MSLIQGKIAGKTIPHKSILITKNNLNSILILNQPLFSYQDPMLLKINILFFYSFMIDSKVGNSTTNKINK
jgi:hypothetical protein